MKSLKTTVLTLLLVLSLCANLALAAVLMRKEPPPKMDGGLFSAREQWDPSAVQEVLSFQPDSEYIRYIYPRSVVLEEGTVQELENGVCRFTPKDGSQAWYAVRQGETQICVLRDGKSQSLTRHSDGGLWPGSVGGPYRSYE